MTDIDRATEVHGTCDPRFEAVRERFAANFAEGHEVGAGVAVTLHGEPVVDLWAGDAVAGERAWERDTIVNCWSVTKTMAAITALVLADRGELDLDAPVADVWPEFAAQGKGGVTTAQVLGHTAGLPGYSRPFGVPDLYDHDACAADLAGQAPWWEPGTQAAYHAVTQGTLLGEVVRRVAGRSLGDVFRTEVAEPLGADFHIGLPASEEGRVGTMVPPPNALGALEGVDTSSPEYRMFASHPIDGTEQNTPAWRAAEIPAAGGTGNARAVARVHSALANGGTVDGVRVLSPEGVDRIFVEQWEGAVIGLGLPMRLGTGFGIVGPSTPLSTSEKACFWGGWGGAICVVDVDLGMSVAYVMNKMAGGLVGDLRGAVLAITAGAAARDAHA